MLHDFWSKVLANQTEYARNVTHAIDLIDRVVRFVAFWIGGFFLLALTVITVVDVTLRSAFNSPIFGGQDIAQLFMIMVVCCSVAYSGRSGGQVAVELFDSFGSERGMRWIGITIKMISVAMLGVLSWHLVISGLDAHEFGEATLTLEISFGPFFIILAVGIALYLLVLVAEIYLLIQGRSIKYEGE
ncbi:MAG TPA: TRAP transporter small permease [Rhodospirillales bacterium]|nr:TRAP transporter small permease [Rhodospirillales bacterium]